MTYNFVVDVPLPIELYTAAHAAIWEAAGDSDHGLILHIARPTDTGFQIIEIWETKEQSERFDAEIAIPTITRLSGGAPMPPFRPAEFTALGLLLPSAGISY